MRVNGYKININMFLTVSISKKLLLDNVYLRLLKTVSSTFQGVDFDGS